jgi:sucrose-6F-phosphate phosphohydrolase
LAVWREKLLSEYSREEAVSFLDQIEGLVMQPETFNTELKTSCFLDQCPDPNEAAEEICGRVKRHAGGYQAVWSSGRDLDILPASSGKGKAIRFLVEHLGMDADRVVVAGDTGNDAAMFEELHKGVVVANAKPELVALARLLGNERAYIASQPHAAGVEEGLEHFGVLRSR